MPVDAEVRFGVAEVSKGRKLQVISQAHLQEDIGCPPATKPGRHPMAAHAPQLEGFRDALQFVALDQPVAIVTIGPTNHNNYQGLYGAYPVAAIREGSLLCGKRPFIQRFSRCSRTLSYQIIWTPLSNQRQQDDEGQVLVAKVGIETAAQIVEPLTPFVGLTHLLELFRQLQSPTIVYADGVREDVKRSYAESWIRFSLEPVDFGIAATWQPRHFTDSQLIGWRNAFCSSLGSVTHRRFSM